MLFGVLYLVHMWVGSSSLFAFYLVLFFFWVQKKRHRQLKTILCGRCRLLSHGHMVTAVGGHGGYPGGKQFVLAEELREKLSHICNEKVLIVKLVSDPFLHTL